MSFTLPIGAPVFGSHGAQPVCFYDCTLCQRSHLEDTHAEIYERHMLFQSEHGLQLFFETVEERKRRYGLWRVE